MAPSTYRPERLADRDAIFGEHVELGKFLDVVVLTITLMMVRDLTMRFYVALGEPESKDNTQKV